MGMSLSSTAGFGFIVPLDGTGEDDPTDRIKNVLSNYGLLTFATGNYYEFIQGAAVLVSSTVQKTWDGDPITLDVNVLNHVSLDEYENLRDVAIELGIEFDPKYITIVSYR